MTQASSITWTWKTQYILTVETDPSGLIPQPARNPIGEPSSADSWWYDAATSVTLTAQTIPDGYSFKNWIVDGNSQGNGVNPIIANMITPRTAIANYTTTPLPPLAVTINPASAAVYVGNPVIFTATPTGGMSPYVYQWFLDGNSILGATSSTWTLTPSEGGIYYVYVRVTDSKGSAAQSETARITALVGPPVGGFAVPLEKKTLMPLTVAYGIVLALFGVGISLAKRRRK
jgi:hypothetical protein